jgi:hypothetical protein
LFQHLFPTYRLKDGWIFPVAARVSQDIVEDKLIIEEVKTDRSKIEILMTADGVVGALLLSVMV